MNTSPEKSIARSKNTLEQNIQIANLKREKILCNTLAQENDTKHSQAGIQALIFKCYRQIENKLLSQPSNHLST